jgi:hypothetical protein
VCCGRWASGDPEFIRFQESKIKKEAKDEDEDEEDDIDDDEHTVGASPSRASLKIKRLGSDRTVWIRQKQVREKFEDRQWRSICNHHDE